MYRTGNGVPKDPVQASDLYLSSARLDNMAAANNIVNMCASGELTNPQTMDLALDILDSA